MDAAVSGRHWEEAVRVLELACACIGEDPKARPTTQELVERLDAIAAAAVTPEIRFAIVDN